MATEVVGKDLPRGETAPLKKGTGPLRGAMILPEGGRGRHGRTPGQPNTPPAAPALGGGRQPANRGVAVLRLVSVQP